MFVGSLLPPRMGSSCSHAAPGPVLETFLWKTRTPWVHFGPHEVQIADQFQLSVLEYSEFIN